MKLIISFLLGITFAFYLFIDHQKLIQEKQIRQHEVIHSVKQNIHDSLYIIKPSDANRLQDCSDESYVYHGGKLHSHKFMQFFGMDENIVNGFKYSANKPVYHYIHGLNSLDEDTIVMLGFRGNTAGPHRSRVTSSLYSVYQRTNNSLIYMPSSFHAKQNKNLEDDKTILQSVCHRRYYDGQYIGSGWPGVSDGHSWQVFNRLFKNKNKLFLFSYSNGQIVREDFINTEIKEGVLKPSYASASNAIEFLKEYDSKTYFVSSKEMERISGIVDIETNYSMGKPLWDLAKFIKNHIDGQKGKLYYAACGIESVVAINHIKLIQSLGLIGYELSNGVVRYMNNERNIIIDILTYNKSNPYTWGRVDLINQTVFLRDNTVEYRLSLGHYMIVPYVTEQFRLLATERKILLD